MLKFRRLEKKKEKSLQDKGVYTDEGCVDEEGEIHLQIFGSICKKVTNNQPDLFTCKHGS